MDIKNFMFTLFFLALTSGNISSKEILEETELSITENFNALAFKHVNERFKIYNKDISDNTINKFLSVTHTFNLDDDYTIFNICISQLCVESQAKHKINGKVVTSSGNAVGITQIVPTTGHFHLRNSLTEEDYKTFYQLGATNLDFIKKTNRYRMSSADRALVIKWLSDETNNLILWGYIMDLNIKKNGNIHKALISYSGGNGFLNTYLKNGNDPKSYVYVKHVNKVLDIFDEKLS